MRPRNDHGTILSVARPKGIARCVAAGLMVLGASANATTVTVNTTATNTANDGKCGLLEAVSAVNQRSRVDACGYTVNGSADSIVFTVTGTHNVSGGLWFNRGVTMTGINRTSTIIRSAGFCTICFSGDASGFEPTLTVNKVTVQYAGGSPVASWGIWVGGDNPPFASVSLDDVRVTGFTNAGISLEGTLAHGFIANSTIENNSRGIWVSEATLQLTGSTVRNNSSRGIDAWYFGDYPFGDVHVYRSTIQGNRGPTGAGVFIDHDGVEDEQTPVLFVELSTISGNETTSGSGGGIVTNANATISGSVLDANKATGGEGGGLFSTLGPSLHGRVIRIHGSTFKNNSATKGGGISLSPGSTSGVHLYMYRSTIGPGNSATGEGGGIFSDQGQLEHVDNVTIDGNAAARGGGIFHRGGGEAHLFHNTITNNTASATNSAGGLYLEGSNNILDFNLFAKNTPWNVVSTNTLLGSSRFNLVADNSSFPGDGNGTPNLLNVDAKLDIGSLKNIGGSTDVRLLFKGSPAIDAIPASTPDDITIDQRGLSRPLDGDGTGAALNDIGAVEMPIAALFEAESMTVAAKSSDFLTTESNSNYSGGIGSRLDGNGVGDFVTYQSGTIQPGTYAVIIRFKKASNAAIFTLAAGSTLSSLQQLGGAQDAYASSTAWTAVNMGSMTVSSSGTRYFKVSATSKNSQSSSYRLYVDCVWLIKTG